LALLNIEIKLSEKENSVQDSIMVGTTWTHVKIKTLLH